MGLHIEDDRTQTLTRRLTALTGESATEAVRVALQERVDRIAPPSDPGLVRAVSWSTSNAAVDAPCSTPGRRTRSSAMTTTASLGEPPWPSLVV